MQKVMKLIFPGDWTNWWTSSVAVLISNHFRIVKSITCRIEGPVICSEN